MKINFSTVLTDLKGGPLKDSGGEELTLSACACASLLSPYPDEQSLDAKDKVRRFKLAQKIANGTGEHDLSVEEIVDLKKLIGKFYAPLVVGRAYEILDPEGRSIANA